MKIIIEKNRNKTWITEISYGHAKGYHIIGDNVMFKTKKFLKRLLEEAQGVNYQERELLKTKTLKREIKGIIDLILLCVPKFEDISLEDAIDYYADRIINAVKIYEGIDI